MAEHFAFPSAFQSTPSAWRETEYNWNSAVKAFQFQSTPSAWRETADSLAALVRTVDISIHSLRMEGDLIPDSHLCILCLISIHSLRMEGDER